MITEADTCRKYVLPKLTQVKVDKIRFFQPHILAELDAVMLSILDEAFKGEL